MKAVILVSLFVLSCAGVKLPPNFQKCNRKQPDLKECVLRSVQDGIPQLTRPFNEVNLPNLHPFVLTELIIGAGTGAVAVEQKFHNCTLDGFHHFHFDKFEFDFEKKTLEILGYCPEVTKKCRYELDGKVMLMPVKGKGDSTIVLKNLGVAASLNFEEIKKGGKTFMKMVSCRVMMEPEMVSYNFGNLFNGDKQLGDNLNRMLNENWKEVLDDVKKDYNNIFEKILLLLCGNFFSKVSMEEAFD
ncbi:hypothetical protein MTP99_006176 [Tenebrio molitor]|nr:hypothetical protein MTP99_006176 [Tenebrio molitor]